MKKNLYVLLTLAYCLLGSAIVGAYAYSGIHNVSSGDLGACFGALAAWAVLGAFGLFCCNINKTIVALVTVFYCLLGFTSIGAFVLCGLANHNSGLIGAGIGYVAAFGMGAGLAACNYDEMDFDL